MTDAHAPRFHNMLETHIRGNKQNLLGNLRAFPPRGTVNEVWNHGIGKYIATYHAVPGKGERSVRLEVELHANSGSNLNNEDPKPRVNKYEYIIVYGMDGRVDVTNPYTADWISVGGEAQYCPLNILEVVSDPLGRPQPLHHRGQRPVDRHGQRRRLGPLRPLHPADLAARQQLRGRPGPDVRRGRRRQRRRLGRLAPSWPLPPLRPLSRSLARLALPEPDRALTRALAEPSAGPGRPRGPGRLRWTMDERRARRRNSPRLLRPSTTFIDHRGPTGRPSITTPSNCPTVRVAGLGIFVTVVQVSCGRPGRLVKLGGSSCRPEPDAPDYDPNPISVRQPVAPMSANEGALAMTQTLEDAETLRLRSGGGPSRGPPGPDLGAEADDPRPTGLGRRGRRRLRREVRVAAYALLAILPASMALVAFSGERLPTLAAGLTVERHVRLRAPTRASPA